MPTILLNRLIQLSGNRIHPLVGVLIAIVAIAFLGLFISYTNKYRRTERKRKKEEESKGPEL